MSRRLSRLHGDYGVTVNTGVCGAPNSGSIPDSRPWNKTARFCGVGLNGELRNGTPIPDSCPSGSMSLMDQMTEAELRKLNDSLDELNQSAKRLNSLRWSLMRGLFVGIGTVIGATLLGALALSFLVPVLRVFDVPVPQSAQEALRVNE